MMPAMSQGRTSQNIPLNTDRRHSDAAVDKRDPNIVLAANPNTSPDLLRNLARSGDRLIRKTVAANPNTPRDILFELASEFPDSVIINPVWNLLFLEDPSAIKDLPLIVQHHVLLQDEVPKYFMELIAASGNSNLCLRLTRHPDTPLSILQKIVNHSDVRVQEAVKLHINWPEPLKESVEERITTTLQQKSSAQSTENSLYYLAKSGLLFDLLGLQFDGNYGELDKIIHPELWMNGLKNLKTKEADTGREFKVQQKQTIAEILAELSQDRDPTIQAMFSRNLQPAPLLFEALFPEEEDGEDDTQNTLEERDIETDEVSQKQRVKRAIGEKILGFYAVLIRNPLTPRWLLSTLASQNLSFARLLVQRPNIPACLLEKLALSEDILVQWEVAQHPNTPKISLKLLALFPDIDVRFNVATNSNTRPFELLTLALDEVVEIRREIAKNPKSPVIALELLARDEDVETRLEVANHRNTPVTSLEQLILDDNFYVRTTAISHPNTPGDILMDLILCASVSIKIRSQTQSTLPSLLPTKFPSNERIRFCQGIVRSTYFPDFVLKKRTITTPFPIVSAALNNPNASVAILKQLLCDYYLYADSSQTYRLVASHYLKHKPQSLPFVLKKLVEYSTDSFERLVALLHPQVTPSALAQNLWSLDWLERYCIAQHPNTPLYTLKELAKDGNRIVRTVAENSLKQWESAASTKSGCSHRQSVKWKGDRTPPP